MLPEQTRSLSDFVDLVRGTTYKSAKLDEPGPVLLGLASIGRDGWFRGDNLRTYGGLSPANLLLSPGDLYVSLKDVTQSGDLLGSVARLPATIPVWRLTQDTVKLCLKNGANSDFLYWVLRSPQYRKYCRSHAIGTTNLSLQLSDFLKFQIPPVIASRSKLIVLLSALDEKIALNRRIGEKLEEIARELFQSWFVDFDPVRRAVTGEDTGLPSHTAALFPKRFADNGVPEGWEIKRVGDVFDIIAGNTPSTEEERLWGGPHAWTTPKDLSRLPLPVLLAPNRTLSEAGLAACSSGLLPVGTLLLSSRAPIGYLGFSNVPTAINQGIAAFRRKNLSTSFAWAWCQAEMPLI